MSPLEGTVGVRLIRRWMESWREFLLVYWVFMPARDPNSQSRTERLRDAKGFLQSHTLLLGEQQRFESFSVTVPHPTPRIRSPPQPAIRTYVPVPHLYEALRPLRTKLVQVRNGPKDPNTSTPFSATGLSLSMGHKGQALAIAFRDSVCS